MTLDPNEFMSTMEKRMLFSDEDKKLLQSHTDWGKEIASDMTDFFYEYLGRDSEMDTIINAKEGRAHRLRETFTKWFEEMFSGMDEWGDQYAQRRWQIGLVHVRIGIGPQHVVPAMATVVREVGNRLQADGKPVALRESLSKVCMIDLAFIEQAYVEVSSNAVLQETGWTEGLFRRLIATGANAM